MSETAASNLPPLFRDLIAKTFQPAKAETLFGLPVQIVERPWMPEGSVMVLGADRSFALATNGKVVVGEFPRTEPMPVRFEECDGRTFLFNGGFGVMRQERIPIVLRLAKRLNRRRGSVRARARFTNRQRAMAGRIKRDRRRS